MALKEIAQMVLLLLVMVLIIGGVVMLTPSSLMGKVKDVVDNTIDKWLSTIKSEKIKQREPLPDDIKKLFDSLTDLFRQTGDKCLTEHPDFSDLGNYQVEIINFKDSLYFKLIKDKLVVDEAIVSNSQVCVVAGKNKDGVAAENFFKFYIDKDQSYKDKLKYTTPAQIKIVNEDTLVVNEGETNEKNYDLEDSNLMFVDGKNICFFPTYDTGITSYKILWQIFTKYGCDQGKGGMDDDCITNLKNKMKKC